MVPAFCHPERWIAEAAPGASTQTRVRGGDGGAGGSEHRAEAWPGPGWPCSSSVLWTTQGAEVPECALLQSSAFLWDSGRPLAHCSAEGDWMDRPPQASQTSSFWSSGVMGMKANHEHSVTHCTGKECQSSQVQGTRRGSLVTQERIANTS